MPEEKNGFIDVKQQIQNTLTSAGIPFDWDNADLTDGITMFRLNRDGKLYTDENGNLVEKTLTQAVSRMEREGDREAVRRGLAQAMEFGDFFLPHVPEEMPRSLGMTGDGDASLQIFEGGKSRELTEPKPLGFIHALLNRWFGFFADEKEYYDNRVKDFENAKINQNAFQWNFETKVSNFTHQNQVRAEEKVIGEKRAAAEKAKQTAGEKEQLSRHPENARKLQKPLSASPRRRTARRLTRSCECSGRREPRQRAIRFVTSAFIRISWAAVCAVIGIASVKNLVSS